MRTCPLCRIDLDEIDLQRELVDRCPECRGVFLDEGELGTIVKMVEIFREIDLDEADIDNIPKADLSRSLVCPADGAPMEPVDLSGVVVDICSECGGIWLDGGEMTARKLAETNLRANLSLYTRLGR
jgi:Zn-finger nucleic acid-binding protein